MYKHLFTCVGPTHYYYVCLQFVRCRFTLRASCVGLDKQLFAQLRIYDTSHHISTTNPLCTYYCMCVHMCVCVCIGVNPGGLEGRDPPILWWKCRVVVRSP